MVVESHDHCFPPEHYEQVGCTGTYLEVQQCQRQLVGTCVGDINYLSAQVSMDGAETAVGGLVLTRR